MPSFVLTAFIFCQLNIVICFASLGDPIDLVLDKNVAKTLKLQGDLRENRLTDDEIKLFVETHNSFRRKEHSSDMPRVSWDNALSEQAQALADRCVYKHTNTKTDKGELTGQNLGAVRNFRDILKSVKKVISLWYGEKRFVDISEQYGIFSCQPGKVCGHYYEVVNSDTKRIGCAYNNCNQIFWKVYGTRVPKQIKAKKMLYIVCQYSQPGVYRSASPYLLGQPCGNCSEDINKGFMCQDGLCVPCPAGNDSCIKAPCSESIVKKDPMYSSACPYIINTAEDCLSQPFFRSKCLDRCREIVPNVNETNFRDTYPYVVDMSRCGSSGNYFDLSE